MQDILRALILDSQERRLELGVPRRLPVVPVRGKATVCIGVRRSGKSTLMRQLAQRLLDAGVSRQDVVMLDFFDDRLHGLRTDGLSGIVEAYDSLFPDKKGSEKTYWFFDEVQTVDGWESFIERLLREGKGEVYLTGSSAHALSKEIATQMRGRALSWEVFPFSFHEFLDARGLGDEEGISTAGQAKVRKAFEAFWQTGGFPEVIPLEEDLRIRIHQEYFHAVLYRDLVERHDIPHPRAIADLAHWLVDNCAAKYTVNRLDAYLRTLGHKVPKARLPEYLDWFEDAYFLFSVRLFDASLSRSNANPKKIYCIDHAMVASVSSGILVNSGHLLENLVFQTLRRCHAEIYYFRTNTGREVDFVVPSRGRKPRLVQVCESLRNPQTRKREVDALTEAMAELGVSEGTIVTRDTKKERIEVAGGVIQAIPAWRFLLDEADGNEGAKAR